MSTAVLAGPARILLSIALAIVSLELVLRFFFKWIAPRFAPDSRIGELDQSMRKYSSRMGEMNWLDPRPHPFLQFTEIRWKASGARGLGFRSLAVRGIPKPAGILRVACLGNSTTHDGYPEQMEEFLNQCGGGSRFQVLNFGIGWWASVHSMLNFVLTVRDCEPDFVVIHENCNDEKYRGYAGMRGDYAHVARPLNLWMYRDRLLYRFSLLYRLGCVLAAKRHPRIYYRPHIGVSMARGKTPDYVPEELGLFRRNIATICELASADGIKVIIPTMPFSRVHRYTEFDETRFHPHLFGANAILRDLAAEQGAALVDLERMFLDQDHFFKDGFHLDEVGVSIKALEIGKVILRSLELSPALDTHWREVEESEPSADAAPISRTATRTPA